MEQKTKPSQEEKIMEPSTSRRSLLKGLAVGAGAGTIGAELLNAGLLNNTLAHAQETGAALTNGDVAIFRFLNAYLVSKGADPVNLDKFRTLKGSQATGAQKNKLRLTNLMQLTVDTSWWTRYRSRTQNPDIDHPTFAQAIPGLSTGKFPAIPRNDGDLTPANHIQAIANTAGFHFGFIEQGGTSLYPTLAQG